MPHGLSQRVQAGVSPRFRRVARAGMAATLGLAFIAMASSPALADQARRNEWWLRTLHVTNAWETTRGSGVTIAVLDTGVDRAQADLTGSVITGPDYTNSGRTAGGPFWGVHGTEVASLIAGHGHGPSQANGIIGIAPAAKVLSVRVTLESYDPQLSNQAVAAGLPHAIARGIRWAVRHDASVIDLPLDPAATPGAAGSGASTAERAAVGYALSKHVVLVAPAGDGGAGTDPVNYPAAYRGVIAVGAFDQHFVKAPFSSHQGYVTVTAAGAGVTAAGPSGTYLPLNSTSAASAIVAGIAALIRAQFPVLTPAQVTRAITSSTAFRRPGGRAGGSGYGAVDAAKALTAAAAIAETVPSSATASAYSGQEPPSAPAVHSGPIPRNVRDTLIKDAIIAGLVFLLLLGLIFAVKAWRRRHARSARLAQVRAAAQIPVRKQGQAAATTPSPGKAKAGKAKAGKAKAGKAKAGKAKAGKGAAKKATPAGGRVPAAAGAPATGAPATGVAEPELEPAGFIPAPLGPAAGAPGTSGFTGSASPAFTGSASGLTGSAAFTGSAAGFTGSASPRFTGSASPAFTGSAFPAFTGSASGFTGSASPAFTGSASGLSGSASSDVTAAGQSSPGFTAASPSSPDPTAAGLSSPSPTAAGPSSPGFTAAGPSSPGFTAAGPPSPDLRAGGPSSPGFTAASPSSPGFTAAGRPSPDPTAASPSSPGLATASPGASSPSVPGSPAPAAPAGSPADVIPPADLTSSGGPGTGTPPWARMRSDPRGPGRDRADAVPPDSAFPGAAFASAPPPASAGEADSGPETTMGDGAGLGRIGSRLTQGPRQPRAQVSGRPPWEPAPEPDSELPWAEAPRPPRSGAESLPRRQQAPPEHSSWDELAQSVWPGGPKAAGPHPPVPPSAEPSGRPAGAAGPSEGWAASGTGAAAVSQPGLSPAKRPSLALPRRIGSSMARPVGGGRGMGLASEGVTGAGPAGGGFTNSGSTGMGGTGWSGIGTSQPPFPPAPRPAMDSGLPDAGQPEKGTFPGAIKPPTDRWAPVARTADAGALGADQGRPGVPWAGRPEAGFGPTTASQPEAGATTPAATPPAADRPQQKTGVPPREATDAFLAVPPAETGGAMRSDPGAMPSNPGFAAPVSPATPHGSTETGGPADSTEGSPAVDTGTEHRSVPRVNPGDSTESFPASRPRTDYEDAFRLFPPVRNTDNRPPASDDQD